MAKATDDRFTEFVRTNGDRLLRLAYLLTGDHGHAEDVVQTALLRCHRRWGRLRDPEAAYAYAKRVVATTASSRRRTRSNQEIVDLPAMDGPGGLDPGAQVGDREQMRALLAELPPRMRAVLVLRFWADLSEADTAAALGCSVNTVHAQATRGLARLRAVLGHELSTTGRNA
jgi:RNA polymerase sigma-70 factor (sigma-E family)